MGRIWIILVVAFFGTIFIIFKLWTSALPIEYGHHFSFENELLIEIDSLTIVIGKTKTSITAAEDSSKSLEGVVEVPKNGYPHKVYFNIFSSGKMHLLKADSFDCYNCDGNHEYRLKRPKAIYKFRN